MMQFVKLKNGILKRCPRHGKVGKLMHTNLPLYFEHNPEMAYAEGWRDLITTDKPDGAHTPSYTEDGNQVVQTWTPVEPVPQEPTLEDDVSQLKTDVAELTDAVLDMSKEVYKEGV